MLKLRLLLLVLQLSEFVFKIPYLLVIHSVDVAVVKKSGNHPQNLLRVPADIHNVGFLVAIPIQIHPAMLFQDIVFVGAINRTLDPLNIVGGLL